MCISSTRRCLILTACVLGVAAQSQSIALLESRLTQSHNISAGRCIATSGATLVSPLLAYFIALKSSSSSVSHYCGHVISPGGPTDLSRGSTGAAAEQHKGRVAPSPREEAQISISTFLLSITPLFINIFVFLSHSTSIFETFLFLSYMFSFHRFALHRCYRSLSCGINQIIPQDSILFLSLLHFDCSFLSRPADCAAAVVAQQAQQQAEDQGNDAPYGAPRRYCGQT